MKKARLCGFHGIVVAAVCAATCAAAFGAYDYIVECGRVRMLVSDNGYLRDIFVGPERIIKSVDALAVCGDKSAAGRGRMAQRSTRWTASQDVAPSGVQILREAEHGRIVIVRKGVFAIGRKKDAKTLAYTQRVEVDSTGRLKFDYEFEFLRTLDWGYQAVSVAIQIPMSLAQGASCVMDQRPPRTIPATWSRAAQVTGAFSTLKLAGLELKSGEGVRGSLQDPRAWSRSGRSSYQYAAMYKSRRWFKGVRPINKGTKWRIGFTVQLPMDRAEQREAAPAFALARRPERPRGKVLFEDDFARSALGPEWVGGAFAKSAVDWHTKDLVASKHKGLATIRDNALDLRMAGRRGRKTALTRIHNIPARCAIEFDLNLKGDDTIGKTQHSIYFRSHSDPGTCLCLHVGTRRQFFFFEVKHKGRYAGERLYYYPFKFTSPHKDQKFRFYIESTGDSGLRIWISGEGIPANNMPITMLGGREWAPFRDGELFFFSSNRAPDAVAHAQWDNIRVSELPPLPWINELYYRNKLLVGFREYLFAPKGVGVNVAVRKTPRGKALVQGTVRRVDWQKSRLLLDVSKLDKGAYVVTADMADRTGKRLGRAVVEFHKVRDPKIKLTDMAVYVDAQNRLIVNGKRFFPIGMYCCMLTSAKRWKPDSLFAEMNAAGFNTLQSYGVVGPNHSPERLKGYVIPWLDSAHKHGLKVYVNTQGELPRRRGRTRDLSDPLCGRMDPLAIVAQNVRALKRHPAILCWYIGDESIAHGVPESAMSRVNRLVKGLDPGHPTAIATCPAGHRNDGLRVTARVCDIPANDDYPMFRKKPAHAWRTTGALSQDAVEGLQAWWAIPQCYARRYGREMTEAEIYVETYIAITHGARGVIWWACFYCRRDHPENWKSTKKLAAELKRISPILLADDCPDKVSLTPTDVTIDSLLKRRGDRRYLICVNHAPKPVAKVMFSVPGVKACRSYFDGRTLKVSRGAFTDAFKPYERKMYELR